MRGGRAAGVRHRALLLLRVWAVACAPLLLAPGAAALSLAALAQLLDYRAFPASAGDVLCHLLAGTPNAVEPLWYLTVGVMTCVPLCVALSPHERSATVLLAHGSRRRAWAHRLVTLAVLASTEVLVLVLGCVLWSQALGGASSLAAPHSALAVWSASARPDGRAPDGGSEAAAVLLFLALVWIAALALVSVGHLLATFTGLPVASVALLAYLVLVAVMPHPWLPGAGLMASSSPFFGAPDSNVVVQVAGPLLVMGVSGLAGGYAFSRVDLAGGRLHGRRESHA